MSPNHQICLSTPGMNIIETIGVQISQTSFEFAVWNDSIESIKIRLMLWIFKTLTLDLCELSIPRLDFQLY